MNYVDLATSHIAELYPLIVYQKPRLMDLPPGAIIGTWAYSVPGKVRFILDKTIEVAPGVMPADLARAWIRDWYKLPLRRKKNQMERGFRAPIHAVKGKHGDCVYVDIKGAYKQILSLGYDVEYRQNHYIGSIPVDLPAEIKANKFSYSISVAMSATQISNLQVMGKEGLFSHKPLNLYSNPCLFNLAQDTLNGIACQILSDLREKCVYINTDGYIVKPEVVAQVQKIIADWGFTSAIKGEGDAEIYGVGSYKIGDDITRRIDPNGRTFTGPMMDLNSASWLQKRWSLWSPKLNP